MDFLINGFPENESHEKKSSAKKNPSPVGDDFEDMMKAMGIQAFQMPSPGANGSFDLTNLMQQMLGMLDPSSLMGNTCSSSSGTSPIQAKDIEFENGDFKAFTSMTLAEVAIEEREDLKSDFATVYGVSSDDNISVDILKDMPFTGEMSKDFFMNNIDHFGITGFSERYILCNAVPNNSDDLGVFFAIVKTPAEFSVIIPKYGNTYDISNGVPSLYNTISNSEMFENGVFRHMNISKVRLGLDWVTYIKKPHSLSPTEFGTIKPILSGAEIAERDGSVYYYLGHLISNDDSETELFKKDMGCENTKVFDFYVKLPSRECPPHVLAKAFKNVDFNECGLFKNTSLKARGSALYIDLDLGVIPKYLYSIFLNRIDNNDYMY